MNIQRFKPCGCSVIQPCGHQRVSHRSLLGMPLAIQQQIFLQAGMANNCLIDLNQKGFSRKVVRTKTSGRSVQDASLQVTHSLLLTCKAMYEVASEIVYSTNKFFIRYGAGKAFYALRTVRHQTLRHLTNLTVVFDIDTRLVPPKPATLFGASDVSAFRHFDPMTTQEQDRLQQWLSTVQYLRNGLTPGRLQLDLVCKSPSTVVANPLLTPLLDLPILRACHLRIDGTSVPFMRGVVNKLVSRSMEHRSLPRRKTFDFLGLPKELRVNVLSFTDLITPCSEVYLCSSKGYHVMFAKRFCDPEHGPASDEVEPVYEGYESVCHPSIGDHSCDYRDCRRSQRSFWSFCRRRALIPWSSCHCWTSPEALFLVCKTMTEDATQVFFGQNRFILMAREPGQSPMNQTPVHHGVSVFFRSIIPQTAMRFLRDIELVFPAVKTTETKPSSLAILDWNRAVDHMAQFLNLSMTSISFHIVNRPDVPDQGWIMIAPEPLYERDVIKRKDEYKQLLKPLQKLRGLAHFTVDVTWLKEWWLVYHRPSTPEVMAKLTKDGKDELRKELELFVMGDKYRSNVEKQTVETGSDQATEPERVSPQRRRSQWHFKVHHHHLYT